MAIEKCMTERSCKLSSEVQSTKDKVFDEVNRETGGWAMTMREAKEPVRDGQVENEQQYTELI